MKYTYKIEKAMVPNKNPFDMAHPYVEQTVGGSFVPDDGKSELLTTLGYVIRGNQNQSDLCMDWLASVGAFGGTAARGFDGSCKLTDDLMANSNVYWTPSKGGEPKVFIIVKADDMRPTDITGCVYYIQDGDVMREACPEDGDCIFDSKAEAEES